MRVEVKRPLTAPEKSRFTVLALATGVLLFFWGLQLALCGLRQAGFVWVEGVLTLLAVLCTWATAARMPRPLATTIMMRRPMITQLRGTLPRHFGRRPCGCDPGTREKEPGGCMCGGFCVPLVGGG